MHQNYRIQKTLFDWQTPAGPSTNTLTMVANTQSVLIMGKSLDLLEVAIWVKKYILQLLICTFKSRAGLSECLRPEGTWD